MARFSILSVMLIVLVASCAFSYHGNCSSNELAQEMITNRLNLEKKFNLRVDLIRRDSPISPLVDARILSNAERLRRAIERSNDRLRRLQHYISQNAGRIGSKSYYSPISASDGEFVMQIGIGYPIPVTLHVIVDTGSDLIWTQCQPCDDYCIPQVDPMYNPAQSSSYKNASCSSYSCLAVGAYRCDNGSNCIYFYQYGDSSYTSGVLAYETFSLATAVFQRRTYIPRIAFGCGHDQGGFFADSAGIVGLGRGPLSLVSQIGSSINNIFSYCLGSMDNASQISPLFLGRTATSRASFSVTPLIRNNPFPSFYYLSLAGINVAGKAVQIPDGTFKVQPDGSGGLVIDSGTTITFLVEPAYRPFLAAVRSAIDTPPVNSSDVGLDLCYNATSDLLLPSITFIFAGGAKFVLPHENSFISNQVDTGGLVCLAFGSSGPTGSISIFGNVQQQNFHIVYDLGQSNLYFAPTNCDSL